MGNLKKIAVFALVAAVVFQCSVLEVSAATAITEPFAYGNVIHFTITSESMKESDFVEAYPQKLYLSKGKAENPLEQPINPLPTQYADIPNHFQMFYSDFLYGDGTVETSGSSITALSMIATYLTGYSYFPDELSRWFAGKADDDVARLTYASEALGLPFEVSQNWQDTYEQLQAGKCVLIQTDSTSLFSDSWHFVVLKGVSEDGKIFVNDPCADNLTKEDLEEKYKDGFEETDISTGFCYAWIYDKEEVPADIARYAVVSSPDGTSRYAALKLTPAEKQLLARVVYVNAYGECEEGQQKLIEVILNRMLSDHFSDELKDVICEESALCDVSRLNAAEPTQVHYMVVERALRGPYLLEQNATDFSYTCHK